ncbi:hypothetical protein ABT115_11490 [Streptomyces sp. NPDC001832]|uniref:hypothetical protein n=1 Tax=Streptomyces sp. NPDC001832 TaxID=3154527 RepID=UPI00331A2AE5
MTTPTAGRAEALATVRAELLRAARADAEALIVQATRDVEAVLDRARNEAEEIVEQAHREGAAEGTAAGAAVLLRARRNARACEQTARREAYEELRHQVTERFRALRYTADYPGIRDRLERRARQLLGPDAAVAEQPGGGVVGHATGRLADFSLDALAARALDRLGADTEALWAP